MKRKQPKRRQKERLPQRPQKEQKPQPFWTIWRILSLVIAVIIVVVGCILPHSAYWTISSLITLIVIPVLLIWFPLGGLMLIKWRNDPDQNDTSDVGGTSTTAMNFLRLMGWAILTVGNLLVLLFDKAK